MKINGREINFLRTVKVTCDIAEMCPNKDIQRIGELFSENDVATTIKSGAKLIHYLNEGYEMNKKYNEPGYEPKILSEEEIMYLDDTTYTKLMQAAMKGMGIGAETTIEVEEPKKKGNHEGVN